ncbi:hypothetical protein PT974_05426 [Cladobotryum mycophilum]|uniref:Uncharacterized protein n=1 Tax=Cladobotryum mycophilum TaxID=491253 RepID=A0ABR0SJT5_9HYPO
MAIPTAPNAFIQLPDEFHFGETVLLLPTQPIEHEAELEAKLEAKRTIAGAPNGEHIEDTDVVAVTSLDVLQRFNGTFGGFGFNTIFRPNSTKTPTPLPVTPDANDPTDNVLQLSLTSETMAFSKALGDVPNRGLDDQGDIILNGISYLQTIIDTTLIEKTQPVLHFEPGLWMRVPESATMPNLAASFTRMGSIPHGTTINAQCFNPAVTSKGPPVIPTASITPTTVSGNAPIPFPNQTFEKNDTHRLPQDLTPFNEAGTITPAILQDPNTVLRNANAGKNIIENTTFTVSSQPENPQLGGGTSNIGFLTGADGGVNTTSVPGRSGNANGASVSAQYWISKVRAEVHLVPGQKTVSPASLGPRDAVPKFQVDIHVQEPRTVTVEYDQIQYSQHVALNFNALSWPHVSVSTLAPVINHKLSSVIVSQ